MYLEAQMAGVPVLGSDSGGIPEAISDGQSGFVVRARDVEALAEKIKFLKNNPDQVKAMGEQAKKFVEENFNWEINIKKHLAEYAGKQSV